MYELMILRKQIQSVKAKVIGVLAEDFPLSANAIFYRLKNDSPRALTYQAVFKVLKELVRTGIVCKENKLYELNHSWICSVGKRVEGLQEAYGKAYPAKFSGAMKADLVVFDSKKQAWNALAECAQNTKRLRIATKACGFILYNEQKRAAFRKSFYDTVIKRVRSGELEFDYLFSYDLVRNRILRGHDSTALKKLKELNSMPNVRLKCCDSAGITSLVVFDRAVFVGILSPHTLHSISYIRFKGKGIKETNALFDSIMENSKDAVELIAELESFK